MSFIAKNPLSLPEIEHTPSTPPGTRGLFAKEDGWYDIDSSGKTRKLGTSEESNLQPDWDQTDEEKADYLKNKPPVVKGEGEASLKQKPWEEEADNSASGKGAVALGGYNKAGGKCSMAANYNNEVNAPNAFAANSGNFIPEEAEGAFVSGHHNEAKSIYQTIVGTYSEVEDDDSFVIGNGSSEANRKNAFKVKKNGDVEAEGNVVAKKANVDGVNARNISVTNNVTVDNKVAAKELEVNNKAAIGSFVTSEKNGNYGENTVVGKGSAALGGGNDVQGILSTAIGRSNAIPEGLESVFVAGYKNTAATSRQFVFGVYANPTTNDMVVVGNGSSDSTRKNAFVVKRNGDAYIGGTTLTLGSTPITEEQLIKLISDALTENDVAQTLSDDDIYLEGHRTVPSAEAVTKYVNDKLADVASGITDLGTFVYEFDYDTNELIKDQTQEYYAAINGAIKTGIYKIAWAEESMVDTSIIIVNGGAIAGLDYILQIKMTPDVFSPETMNNPWDHKLIFTRFYYNGQWSDWEEPFELTQRKRDEITDWDDGNHYDYPTVGAVVQYVNSKLHPTPIAEEPSVLEPNNEYHFGLVDSLHLRFPSVANAGDVIYINFFAEASDGNSLNLVIDTTNTSDIELVPENATGYEIFAKYIVDSTSFLGDYWVVNYSEYTKVG